MKTHDIINHIRSMTAGGLVLAAVTLCSSAAHAQVGNDFFDYPTDSWLERTSYGTSYFRSIGGELYFFRPDADPTKVIHYWQPTTLPTTQDWQVELDVALPDLSTSQRLIQLGIYIENAIDSRDWLDFSMNDQGYLPTRGAMATICNNGTQQGFGYGRGTSADQVTLRIEYTASTRRIVNRCAFGGVASGALFTLVSQGTLPWNLSTSAGIKVGIVGSGRNTGNGSARADNFSFSSPPGTPGLLIAPAVELAWKSERNKGYRIQSRSVTSTKWKNDGEVIVGTGTVMRHYRSSRPSPHRLYRLVVVE